MKLFLSEHVKDRMLERNIKLSQINEILKYGKRSPAKNNTVMHWSTKTDIAIIVDWHKLYVVTVFRLTEGKRNILMRELIEQKKREMSYVG